MKLGNKSRDIAQAAVLHDCAFSTHPTPQILSRYCDIFIEICVWSETFQTSWSSIDSWQSNVTSFLD